MVRLPAVQGALVPCLPEAAEDLSEVYHALLVSPAVQHRARAAEERAAALRLRPLQPPVVPAVQEPPHPLRQVYAAGRATSRLT